MIGQLFENTPPWFFASATVFLASVAILSGLEEANRVKPPAAQDPFKACLRDWPLAECQARKDAGVM